MRVICRQRSVCPEADGRGDADFAARHLPLARATSFGFMAGRTYPACLIGAPDFFVVIAMRVFAW
jgi:hypothetical protein